MMKMNNEILNKIIKHTRCVKELEYELSRKENYYNFFKMSEYDLLIHDELIEFHKMKIIELNNLLKEAI